MKIDNPFPQTVEEAVEQLIANMSLNDEIRITLTEKEDLHELHLSLGEFVRNGFGLWSGNQALLESCRLCAGDPSLESDDASNVIIFALWWRLAEIDEMGLRT